MHIRNTEQGNENKAFIRDYEIRITKKDHREMLLDT